MNYKKLMNYNQYLRHAYFDTFGKLSWGEFVKDRGASFGSIRNVFLHCVEVLDRYVNQRCKGAAERPRIDFEAYDTIEKIEIYLERVESDANLYLEKLTSEELSRRIERKFKDGTIVWITIEDALIDVFQELIHHYGEFIALLWQMQIEPPHLGWSRFISR